MTIKQIDSGRYEISGQYGSVSFVVGICDTLEHAEEIDRQLGSLQPAEEAAEVQE